MYICSYLKWHNETHVSFYMLCAGITSRWILFMLNSDLLSRSESDFTHLITIILYEFTVLIFFLPHSVVTPPCWSSPPTPHPPSPDATLSTTALVWADDSPCCRGMSGRQRDFFFSFFEDIWSEAEHDSFWPTRPWVFCFVFLNIPGNHLKNGVNSNVIVDLYTHIS